MLKLHLPYVGLLGPRKRRDQLLNAVLALVSEIQAVFAGASAESLRDRKAPIHRWTVVRRAVPAEACVTSAP